MNVVRVERRPGKLWAVLQFPLTRILIAFGAIALVAFPVLAGASAAHLHGLAFAAAHLLSGLLAWGIYLAYVRLLERRKLVEFPSGTMLPQLLQGFAVGLALYCATVGILWLSGAYRVDGINPEHAVWVVFINALGAALLEEIAVRGVLFRIMEEGLGTWIALAISAAIFGLLHAMNPGASWISVAGIALEAGLLLAAAYVYARQLWICIGLHCAWNFTEGGVFGANVSGAKSHGLLLGELQGPDWLSGGRFGTETSLVAVLLCLTATVGFLLLARRRGHIMAPSWKRS
ncbi:MAG TPA: type II CAAX endopeptidase family protein [Gammaproteobacteria bacterium]|nr:type II CAAX endopeptidase family protein [Gammaproteobacteria bacterium]